MTVRNRRARALRRFRDLPKESAAARVMRCSRAKEQRDRYVEMLLAQLRQELPPALYLLFYREVRVDPTRQRRWRFDLACKPYRLGIEIHGGVWHLGRHVRGPGFIGDREKKNAAVEWNWHVLEYWPEVVRDGTAARQIARVLKALVVAAHATNA